MTVGTKHQTLQEFFDTPSVMATRHKLSASAMEPVPTDELLSLEPGAEEAFRSSGLDYPERYGPAACRQRIAEKYHSVDLDGVQITSGLDEALGLLFVSLVDPGDRVIVLTPCYPPHRELALWRGADTVEWTARAERDWVPDLDELRDLLRPSTRLVVVTFPQNPTGFMPDDAYLNDLVEIVRAAGAVLISDEIYDGLPIDGPGPVTLVDRYERAVSLHGLSKTCGLPGLRFGWTAIRDPDLQARLRTAKNLFNCYVPGPIAVLADLALRHESRLVNRADSIRGRCLDAADGFFKRHDNLFDWHAPSAGTVAFPRWLGPGGTKALSDRLVSEASVSLAPSTCFGAGDAHFRIGLTRRSFADALDQFDRFLVNQL